MFDDEDGNPWRVVLRPGPHQPEQFDGLSETALAVYDRLKASGGAMDEPKLRCWVEGELLDATLHKLMRRGLVAMRREVAKGFRVEITGVADDA